MEAQEIKTFNDGYTSNRFATKSHPVRVCVWIEILSKGRKVLRRNKKGQFVYTPSPKPDVKLEK